MAAPTYNGRTCATVDCDRKLTGRQRTTCAECRMRDRHRTRDRSNDRRTSHKAPYRYAGVDGEGVDGRYVMLAWHTDDGEGYTIENVDGLSTSECLNFLCEIPKRMRCWGFAFGYDVNMMLGDLPRRAIEQLHREGTVYWRDFRIAYVPGKRLQVSKRTGHGRTRRTVATTTVWDMFTWAQSSFAKWIAAWELCTADELAAIVEMKGKRSTFALDEMPEIRHYCLSECDYLARGARRLCDLIAATGINTRGQFYSAATLSGVLMRENDVNEYRKEPPRKLRGPIEQAYFGGRAEAAQVGPIPGPIYGYDLRSAYPSKAVDLPCLKCGRWRRVPALGENRYIVIERVKPWSMVRVSWKPLKGKPRPVWGPLPLRPTTGTIRYPTRGSGWYWGVEVLAASRHAQIQVEECWTYTTPCAHKPFAYLRDVYDKRRALKAAGDPTEYVLKIALNGSYGKLAERPTGPNHHPKFRCLAWAGWITAATRASILDACEPSVVTIATDGILSTAPLALDDRDVLGGWECDVYDELWCGGPGVYFTRQGDVWKPHTRGFNPADLTLDVFRDLWADEGRTGKATLRRARFIGMGVALNRLLGFEPPLARLWRQFVTEVVVKSIDLTPRRAWLSDDPRDGRTIAPTLTQHRKTERENRVHAAKMRAEYRALCADLAALRATPDDVWMTRPALRLYRLGKEQQMLDRLTHLAGIIEVTSGRARDDEDHEPTLFAVYDDPSI